MADKKTPAPDLGALGDKILQGGPKKMKKKAESDAPSVTVSDIFNLLAEGKTKGGMKYIRRTYPHILPRTIVRGQAWLVARRPDLYDTLVANVANDNNRTQRMLLDECVSVCTVPAIRNNFGHATHVNFIGLNGQGDSGPGDAAVWNWAVANKMDAILTRDRRDNRPGIDLTRIARDAVLARMAKTPDDLSNLPVIVHIMAERGDYRSLSRLFNKNRATIENHLRVRTAPVLSLSEGGVLVPGTYKDVWERYGPAARP